MNKAEFLQIIVYLGEAIGKPLTKERTEIYFDLLGDLPADILRTAARRAVLEHPWATFPSIAELRAAAAETIQGDVKAMSADEAWGIAYRAASRIDCAVDGSAERACRDLPPLVIEAMRIFGVVQLCSGSPEYMRRDFVRLYESLAAREKRLALLPASVKESIARIGQVQSPSILAIANGIGRNDP